MDDEKIVELYWERNALAIDRTAEKYGNYCSTIARNILRNEEDSEEFQIAFHALLDSASDVNAALNSG